MHKIVETFVKYILVALFVSGFSTKWAMAKLTERGFRAYLWPNHRRGFYPEVTTARHEDMTVKGQFLAVMILSFLGGLLATVIQSFFFSTGLQLFASLFVGSLTGLNFGPKYDRNRAVVVGALMGTLGWIVVNMATILLRH